MQLSSSGLAPHSAHAKSSFGSERSVPGMSL